MLASRQVEVPFCRDIGPQSVRGVGALAQVLGRTAFPSLRKYIIPAARRKVDFLEFSAPQIAEIVSGRKNFKTAAKSVGRQTLRKQLGEGSRKRTGSSSKKTASKVIPTKSAKQISRSRRNFFTNISP